MRLYRSIILLLSSVGVILVASACHYRYYLTVQEIQPIAIGSIHFNGAELHISAGDTATREIMLEDTSKTYVRIFISVEDTVESERQLSLIVDSVFVELDEPFQSQWVSALIAINSDYGIYDGLKVSPIGVPSDYKRDFKVSFRLQIFDTTNDKLILVERFTAMVEYYDHKYFLFNSPYD